MAPKLNYRFHNPNSPEQTAEFLAKLFVEVNTHKVDNLLHNEIKSIAPDSNCPSKKSESIIAETDKK